MTKKTETKLGVDSNGQIVKTEVPLFEAPETLDDVNFVLEDDLLLGEFIPVTEKTKSGIIIPESVQKDKAPKAILVAVGDNLKDRYQRGDMVIFKPSPPVIQINDKDYIVLQRFNLVGKYKS